MLLVLLLLHDVSDDDDEFDDDDEYDNLVGSSILTFNVAITPPCGFNLIILADVAVDDDDDDDDDVIVVVAVLFVRLGTIKLSKLPVIICVHKSL